MTTLGWAGLGGGSLALALVMLVARFWPRQVDLADALTRLAPATHPSRTPQTHSSTQGSTDRLGRWAQNTLPGRLWLRTPTKDLALLGIPTTRFYGEQVLCALAGLVTAPLLVTALGLLSPGLSFTVPVAATVLLAATMFQIPHYTVATRATKTRTEFRRGLSLYTAQLAQRLITGTGVAQAMEDAAQDSPSWVLNRIEVALARTRRSGVRPWETLKDLADQIAVPELRDLAETLDQAGTENTAIYDSLRKSADAQRNALRNHDLAAANAIAVRMAVAGAFMALTFVLLLMAPAVMRMLTPV